VLDLLPMLEASEDETPTMVREDDGSRALPSPSSDGKPERQAEGNRGGDAEVDALRAALTATKKRAEQAGGADAP
jgi:hypothetical protein